MKINPLLFLAASALALVGCSTPTTVDKGPIKAHTFSFIAQGPKASAGNGDKFAPVHAMIQDAIITDLAQKGLGPVDAGGDVTVAYLLIAGNNGATVAIDDYFGSRDDTLALHDKAQKAYTGNKNPNYFRAGTLVIDLIDTKTSALLWRRNATRPLLQNPTADTRAAAIQEVVNQMTQDLHVLP